jgi:hypothetical protein
MGHKAWVRILIGAGAVALVFGLAACDPEDWVAARFQAERTETTAFAATGVPVVTVESSNGSVSVRGVAGQTDVRVTATVRSRGRSQAQANERAAAAILRMEQQGGRIVLAYRGAEQTDDVRRFTGVEFEVTAPPMLELTVATSNGQVTAAAAQGRFRIDTSNGALTLTDLIGQVEARTSNGRIDVERCQGVLDLTTSNGEVAMAAVSAALDVDTSNGPITFGGTVIGDANRLATSNGKITVAVALSASVEFDARTSAGAITSTLPLVGDTQGKEWLATLNPPAQAKLRLVTSNGAIVISPSL